jgi:hypothetical protein
VGLSNRDSLGTVTFFFYLLLFKFNHYLLTLVHMLYYLRLFSMNPGKFYAKASVIRELNEWVLKRNWTIFSIPAR